VDHRFARQFVIGAPFGENFGRGTGGTKKAGVERLDQASASTRASRVSGHGAPVRLRAGSAEIAEAQRFNVTIVPSTSDGAFRYFHKAYCGFVANEDQIRHGISSDPILLATRI